MLPPAYPGGGWGRGKGYPRGRGRGRGSGGGPSFRQNYRTKLVLYGTTHARLVPYTGHVDDLRLAGRPLFSLEPGPTSLDHRASVTSTNDALCATELMQTCALCEDLHWKAQFGTQVVYFGEKGGLPASEQDYLTGRDLEEDALQQVVDGPCRSSFAAMQIASFGGTCQLVEQLGFREARREFILRAAETTCYGEKFDLTVIKDRKENLLQDNDFYVTPDPMSRRLAFIVVVPGAPPSSSAERLTAEGEDQRHVVFRVTTTRMVATTQKERLLRLRHTEQDGVSLTLPDRNASVSYARMEERRIFRVPNTAFEVYVTSNQEWGQKVGRNGCNTRVELRYPCTDHSTAPKTLFGAFLARAVQLCQLLHRSAPTAATEVPASASPNADIACRSEARGDPCPRIGCPHQHRLTACLAEASGGRCRKAQCNFWHAVRDVQSLLTQLCKDESASDEKGTFFSPDTTRLTLDSLHLPDGALDNLGQAVPMQVAVSTHLSRIQRVCDTGCAAADTAAELSITRLAAGSRVTEVEGRSDSRMSTLKELVAQYNAFAACLSAALRGNMKDVFFRACRRMESPLPLLAARPALVEFCSPANRNPFLLLAASTGSGKSTQVPQYLAECAREEAGRTGSAGSARGSDTGADELSEALLRDLSAPPFAASRGAADAAPGRPSSARPSQKLVICVQPRALAATTLAERVAVEYDGVDATPGLRVCFASFGNTLFHKARCHILYITQHALMQKIQNKSIDFEKEVYAVVVDEAHERSVIGDMLLGVLKEMIASTTRNGVAPFRLVVCSATLQIDLYKGYLPNAASLVVPGRAHPVFITYTGAQLSDPSQKNYIQATVNAVQDVLEQPLAYLPRRDWLLQSSPGAHDANRKSHPHILAFLPTAADVETACELFALTVEEKRAVRDADAGAGDPDADQDGALVNWHNVQVHSISGRQDITTQRAAFERVGDEVVKVIFASPVAETAVTINGVGFVVDSGLTRTSVYDPARSMTEMVVSPITQSAARQRAGRAGRTGPGACIRLYSHIAFRSFHPDKSAALFTAPLHSATLQVALLGRHMLDFDWVEKPTVAAVHATLRELAHHGAFTSATAETDPAPPTVSLFGRYMLQLEDVDIAVARLVFAAMQAGDPELLAVASLSAAVAQLAPRVFFSPKGRAKELEAVNRAYAMEHGRAAQGDMICLTQIIGDALARLSRKPKKAPAATPEKHDRSEEVEEDADERDDLTTQKMEGNAAAATKASHPADPADDALADARAFAERHFIRFGTLGRIRAKQCLFFRTACRLANRTAQRGTAEEIDVPVLDPARMAAHAGAMQKLLATSFSLHLAVKTGEEKMLYRSVGRVSLECVMMNSSFVKQSAARPDALTFKGRTCFAATTLPEFCVFSGLVSYSANQPAFMSLCTPVEPAWLPASVQQAAEEEHRKQEVSRLLPVPSAIVNMWNLRGFAAWLSASLDGRSCRLMADYEHNGLTVVCERRDQDAVAKGINAVLHAAIASARATFAELPLSGLCRVTCREGGELCEVLRGENDFVMVEFTGKYDASIPWPWHHVHSLIRDWRQKQHHHHHEDETAPVAIHEGNTRDPYARDPTQPWRVFATFPTASEAKRFVESVTGQSHRCDVTPYHKRAPLSPHVDVTATQCNVSVRVYLRDTDPETNWSQEVPSEACTEFQRAFRAAIPPEIETISEVVNRRQGCLRMQFRAPNGDALRKLVKLLTDARPPKQAPQAQQIFINAMHQLEFMLPRLVNHALLRIVKAGVRQFVRDNTTCSTFRCDSAPSSNGHELSMTCDDAWALHKARVYLEKMTTVHPLFPISMGDEVAVENRSRALSLHVRELLHEFDFASAENKRCYIRECQVQFDEARRCLCFIGEERVKELLVRFLATEKAFTPPSACVRLSVRLGRTAHLDAKEWFDKIEERCRKDRQRCVVIHRQGTVLLIAPASLVEFTKTNPILAKLWSAVDGEERMEPALVDGGVAPPRRPLLLPDADDDPTDPNALLASLTPSECSICFSPLASPSYRLVCGHEACLDCLRGPFNTGDGSVPTLPLRCVAEGCGAAWSPRDILEIAPAPCLSRLAEFLRGQAIQEGMSRGREVKPCVNALCLGVPSVVSFDKRDCAGCGLQYCEVCSFPGKPPRAWHDGFPHRQPGDNRIEEILNAMPFAPECPVCKEPFLDFSGCFAISCSKGDHFCGFCMDSYNDSSTTHTHVMNCERNPGKSYFAPIEVFFQRRAEDLAAALEERLAKENTLDANDITRLFTQVYERMSDRWPHGAIEKVKHATLERVTSTPTKVNRPHSAPLANLHTPQTVVAPIASARINALQVSAAQMLASVKTPFGLPDNVDTHRHIDAFEEFCAAVDIPTSLAHAARQAADARACGATWETWVLVAFAKVEDALRMALPLPPSPSAQITAAAPFLSLTARAIAQGMCRSPVTAWRDVPASPRLTATLWEGCSVVWHVPTSCRRTSQLWSIDSAHTTAEGDGGTVKFIVECYAYATAPSPKDHIILPAGSRLVVKAVEREREKVVRVFLDQERDLIA